MLKFNRELILDSKVSITSLPFPVDLGAMENLRYLRWSYSPAFKKPNPHSLKPFLPGRGSFDLWSHVLGGDTPFFEGL